MNKRADAGLPLNKMIILILVVLVIVIVAFAAWKFGLIDYLKNLPGLNQTGVNTDLVVIGNIRHYASGDVKVLLDDGEARCIVLGYVSEQNKIDTSKGADGKSKDGYYGLHKGKLIFKDTGAWEDIDSGVATSDMIKLREIAEKMYGAKNSLTLDFEHNGKTGRKVYFVEKKVSDLDYGVLQAGLEGIGSFAYGKTKENTNLLMWDVSGSSWRDVSESEMDAWKRNLYDAFVRVFYSKGFLFDLDKGFLKYQPAESKYVYAISPRSRIYSYDPIGSSLEWKPLGIFSASASCGAGDEKAVCSSSKEWQDMINRKNIKEDLIKICSSK
ncbi:MAG: hypothetical protein KKB21_03975 [Nanoarchaeota archaeon]|nr:hypothetical protein [Nanoarchaeota archaeon]